MITKNEAIAIIEECRKIHLHYAEWQESDENWREQTTPDENTGGPEHHREWVANYDKVLEVLNEL